MVVLKVKWGGKQFDVDVDTTQPVELFKAQLQSLTGVPTDRQKISGLKGGMLKDDAVLSSMGLKEGQKVMMMGTADAIPEAPTEKVKFLEDLSHAEAAKQFLPSGLTNLDNTCYLNATLQAIRIVPELRNSLVSFHSSSDQAERDSQTATSLRGLFQQMDATPEVVTPHLFVSLFRAHFPQFGESENGRHMQQDAEEAWSTIMNACANVMSKDEGNVVDNLFQGRIQATYKCVESDSEPEEQKMEAFRRLQCHIHNQTSTLEMGLLEGMADKVTKQSPSLGRDAVYMKDAKLVQLPQYLTVQMMRFYYRTDTKKKAKIVRPVAFPFILDTYQLCSDELKKAAEPGRTLLNQRRDLEMEAKRHQKKTKLTAEEAMDVDNSQEDELALKMKSKAEEIASHYTASPSPSGYYELCGVVSHKGRDADGGHYVAWVKHKDDWLLFDDSRVEVVREDRVKGLHGGAADDHLAYMLLYRAKNTAGEVCGPP